MDAQTAARVRQVAKNIHAQLGGNLFEIMTGASAFAGLNEKNGAMSFRLPSTPNFVKEGINYVKITLDYSDTYTVEFGRWYAGKYTEKKKIEGVYDNSLKEIFVRYTGLDVRL